MQITGIFESFSSRNLYFRYSAAGGYGPDAADTGAGGGYAGPPQYGGPPPSQVGASASQRKVLNVHCFKNLNGTLSKSFNIVSTLTAKNDVVI